MSGAAVPGTKPGVAEPPGEPTNLSCFSCLAENPPEASFCRECGGRLAGDPSAAVDGSAHGQLPSLETHTQASQEPAIHPTTGYSSDVAIASGATQQSRATSNRPQELPHSYENHRESQNAAADDESEKRLEPGTLISAESPHQRVAATKGSEPPATPAPQAAGRARRQPVELGRLHSQSAIAPPLPDIGHSREANRSDDPQTSGDSPRICIACGGSSGPEARFCQLCGVSLERGSSDHQRVNPPVAVSQDLPDAQMVVIAQDGSPGRKYPLSKETTSIGNGDADINLRKDPYVSPSHALISYRSGRFYLEDQGSLNGVFVRLGGSVPLTTGDLLLVGLGVLRFEVVAESEQNLTPQTREGTRVFGTPPAPRYARLTTQTVEGVARDRYYLSRAETVLGREVGDIVFTDDPFMSRRHAAIRRDPKTNQFTIRDLGSSNGTFVALRAEYALSPGDHIRIGQHLFRLDVHGDR